MSLPEYLASVARDMENKSAAIRQGFARHRLSGGENREGLVKTFLVGHLPKRFGVSTGLIISHDGMFSNQADLVVVDNQNNAPLYPEYRNKLWPVEAIYALIEVKTHLSVSDLKDAISKGRRFKSLQRRFCKPEEMHIQESLFIIWSFESPNPITLKSHLIEILSEVPVAERPDLIIVPDCLVAKSGSYLELVRIGQPNSKHRRDLESQHGRDLSKLLSEPVDVSACGENSLLAWYIWFDSWLRQAGPRFTDPISYLAPNTIYGVRV